MPWHRRSRRSSRPLGPGRAAEAWKIDEIVGADGEERLGERLHGSAVLAPAVRPDEVPAAAVGCIRDPIEAELADVVSRVGHIGLSAGWQTVWPDVMIGGCLLTDRGTAYTAICSFVRRLGEF